MAPVAAVKDFSKHGKNEVKLTHTQTRIITGTHAHTRIGYEIKRARHDEYEKKGAKRNKKKPAKSYKSASISFSLCLPSLALYHAISE